MCRNCDLVVNGGEESPPLTPQSAHQDDDDPYDDEQTKILRIKQQLEDPHQSDDAVVDLLQTLADMDLTFKGLKETDIGRHVNRLRKHQSSEVRLLVKHLVRKWKELVDEWVGSNNTNNDHQRASSLTDGDSPLLQNVPRKAQNVDQQGPDFGYSPNPHNWSESPSADRINTELEYRPKSVVPKRETSSRPVMQSSSSMAPSASVPQSRPRKEQNIDPDRLASARKRLQENYQEAQNAKKQRTIQVMDIHEIPKPKNGFIAKNKGNFQGRHHR
nr:probable mediator of RNA polymerase II transcription subunit 26c [Tanacetum cinerariifolium]